MKSRPIQWSCEVVALLFGLAVAASTPLAAQNSCQAVIAAKEKGLSVPAHVYMDMAHVPAKGADLQPSDIHHAETIYIGAAAFTKLRGRWQRSQWTAEKVMKGEQESRQTAATSCEYLGDEAVNGERAAVYSTHSERDKAKSDGEIWISKRRGLPLRCELDVEMTGGVRSKDHVSTRYEYGNVRPPI